MTLQLKMLILYPTDNDFDNDSDDLDNVIIDIILMLVRVKFL